MKIRIGIGRMADSSKLMDLSAGWTRSLVRVIVSACLGVSAQAASSMAPVPQATVQPWDSIATLPCAPESEYIGSVAAVVQPAARVASGSAPAPATVSEARLPASQGSKNDIVAASAVLDPAFCAEWNPDYGLRGVSCCGQKGIVQVRSRRRRPSCGPMRAKGSYCDERTLEQVRYESLVKKGEVEDILGFLDRESLKRLQQSYCSVGDGFLAWGKPVIGTEVNRIIVKNPERCVNYGTDQLISVLEWTGRQVADRYQGEEYAGVRLVVGNLSAPRGGCLSGRSGKRGHSSHTSGRDADLALFSARPGKDSPVIFQTQLDPEPNFWLLSRVFANPEACVKVVFLDKRHIRTLAKWALKNGLASEWERMSPYIKHVRGHRNHIHVRVGDLPGAAGCNGHSSDLEEDEEAFESEGPAEGEEDGTDSLEGESEGEVAEILKSLGAKPLRPQESKNQSPPAGESGAGSPPAKVTGEI